MYQFLEISNRKRNGSTSTTETFSQALLKKIQTMLFKSRLDWQIPKINLIGRQTVNQTYTRTRNCRRPIALQQSFGNQVSYRLETHLNSLLINGSDIMISN